MTGTSKKIIILFVIVLLGGTAVFAYKMFGLYKQVDKNSVTSSSSAPMDEVRRQEFDEAIKKTAALDQDADGISDSEEVKYKTSATSSDTDEDGLTDWQEIFNFKTDPLKADTDGDAKNDGYEIRRGTNPNKA